MGFDPDAAPLPEQSEHFSDVGTSKVCFFPWKASSKVTSILIFKSDPLLDLEPLLLPPPVKSPKKSSKIFEKEPESKPPKSPKPAPLPPPLFSKAA